jgi:Na+/citrate or Na+/malate symporter
MAKVAAGVVGGLILLVLLGIVLTAIGKFLLAVALVVGGILIVGLVLAAVCGLKVWEFWK